MGGGGLNGSSEEVMKDAGVPDTSDSPSGCSSGATMSEVKQSE